MFLTCYAPALFRDQQFAYRDASEYYYWLNKRVQAAWDAGRWPLWEPEENAGMPLLGNPTAAVLYPGKVVFAVLPYAWAARAYILAHSALAFLSMLILMRSWGTSWIGSALSALAYAFGGPILFQYSNVIYLIGAAWLPLGVHAVDRWVRLGRRWGLAELAIVLSMQILGGEPQAAYLLGVASIGYAAGLAWSRRDRGRRSSPAPGPAVRRWDALAAGGHRTGPLVPAEPGARAVAARAARSRETVSPVPLDALGGTGCDGGLGPRRAGLPRSLAAAAWRIRWAAMWLGLAGAATLAAALDGRPALAGHRVHPADGPFLGSRTRSISSASRRSGWSSWPGPMSWARHSSRMTTGAI